MGTEKQMELAGNSDTSKDILRELARAKMSAVRSYVAVNYNTPLASLQDLAKDEDWIVRRNVVMNRNSSSKILCMVLDFEKSLINPSSYVIKALFAHQDKLPHIAKVIIKTLYGDML